MTMSLQDGQETGSAEKTRNGDNYPGSVITMSLKDRRFGSSEGLDLWDLVLRQNPYGPAKVNLNKHIEMVGPAKGNHSGQPFPETLQTMSEMQFMEAPLWMFGDRSYRITKALRITYTYKDSDEEDEAYEASILIGFQGPGGMAPIKGGGHH
jgi:hypothetical protein